MIMPLSIRSIAETNEPRYLPSAQLSFQHGIRKWGYLIVVSNGSTKPFDLLKSNSSTANRRASFNSCNVSVDGGWDAFLHKLYLL